MNPEVTKQEYYNDAWTYLMVARRKGDLKEIQRCASRLELAAKELNQEHELAPCSHFMVANGRCINCHEIVGATTN